MKPMISRANTGKMLAGAGVGVVMAATLAFAPGDATPAPDEQAPVASEAEGTWTIRATGARIIGGYGHNFAYDGENVRPLRGQAEATVNTADGTGQVVVEIETTAESGPIRFSEDQSFDGRIRIVQKLNTRQMVQARMMEDVRLHGDTGNEAPVMPTLYNYFATWGPASISVNGSEAVPMIGSHTMFTEQARGPDGRITKNGQVYSPRTQDKEGFTNPQETEFHFVAHTTEPDEDNFPPHTAWIHLHFSDVEIVEKPEDATVPYTSADR